jgi:hypothetical protein
LSEKTVYILGAGFSYDAGFPLQNKILKRIFEFTEESIPPPPLDILRYKNYYYDILEPARETLIPFLEKVFRLDTFPSLEDIFTLLDQTIASRGYCHGYNTNDLEHIRLALAQAIIFVFHHYGEHIDGENEDFYRAVAAYLIHRRMSEGQEKDPFSIILVNCD